MSTTVYQHPRFPDYPSTVDIKAEQHLIPDEIHPVARQTAIDVMSTDTEIDHLVVHVDGYGWQRNFIYTRSYLQSDIDRHQSSTTSI